MSITTIKNGTLATTSSVSAVRADHPRSRRTSDWPPSHVGGRWMGWHFGLVCSVITAALFGTTVSSAQTITEGMQQQIPSMIQFLNDQQLKNVGVLKFRVRKAGSKEVSDRVGPINSLLADRLELGLILANPFEESQQLNIIEGASDQVAKISDANHLDELGRKRLFEQEYQLAWGDETVRADAFLTGGVVLNPDNVTAKVVLLCVRRNGQEAEQIGKVFTAQLDAQSLTESGASFVLRGAFDNQTPAKPSPGSDAFEQAQQQKQQVVLKEVVRVKSQQAEFPLNDSSAPMRLEIRYDGQVMPLEMRDGEAFVREPREGQNVELVLIRNPAAVGRLGAVLKVNGENTLYRSTIRDLDAPKWIFSPRHQRTVVRGYQLDKNRIDKFKILSDEESQVRAIDYGRHVGQIQLTVFQELTGPDPQEFVLDEDEEDLVAMFRGVHPPQQPQNLSALKHQIRLAGKTNPQTRGIIVGGENDQNKINIVKFKPDPTPAMSATVTYYK